MTVRIALTGATGRTGNPVAHGLARRDDVVLAACVAPSVATTPSRPLPDGVPGFAQLADVPRDSYDVLVDLTHADGVAQANIALALEQGVPVVIGTTGLSDAELDQFGKQAQARGIGVLYAPNFSIGALLLMRFAAGAAHHFPDVEIVETHHPAKRDAPSGTARRTAELVAMARPGNTQTVAGDSSRGLSVSGVQVHSLRLAGANAHQEVVFGGAGELLTIRHDVIDRACYSTGVALAAQGVTSVTGLIIGLEHML